MLDALTFVLFNKPFRKINKPQLVNTTNGRDCLVEIEFSINSRNYLVRRGIKPSIFDIEIDGNLLHKESDDRANQKMLEQNILKVNYKSFTQIAILGSSNFVPFMQLIPTNRREVIEDLLDIKIFSSMSNIVKEKIKSKKDQVKLLTLKKETLKDKMQMQKEFIEELEGRGYENINNNKIKINKLLEEGNSYISDNEKLNYNIKNIQCKLDDFTDTDNSLVELNNLKGKITQEVNTINKEHKFFTKNTVCPTCMQDIQ